jgi:hypothetical protein
MNEILAEADVALAATQNDEPKARRNAMADFLRCFERIAQEVQAGTSSWESLRPWALCNAGHLLAAYKAMEGWQGELVKFAHERGEEGVERALAWRSQFAFARELYRGTPAEELLEIYDDQEGDRELRESAESLGFEAPDYIPRTHTWWRWRDDG